MGLILLHWFAAVWGQRTVARRRLAQQAKIDDSTFDSFVYIHKF